MTLAQAVKQFQAIDREIVSLIAQRMKLAEQMGKLKKKIGIPVRNKARETIAIERARVLAQKKRVNPDTVEKVMNILIKSSRDIQSHV